MTLVLHGPSYNPALPVITPEALATSINNEFTAFWLPLAGGVVSGPLSAPTPAPGDNSTRVATTAFVGAGYLPISGGAMAGPLTYTATGGTVARSAQDRAADVVNVLDYGADPTGVADSTAAFNAAAAQTVAGGFRKSIWCPAGIYLITGQITLNGGQGLCGDTQGNTVLQIDQRFSATAASVIFVTQAPYDPGPTIRDLTFSFAQPDNVASRATFLTLAQGGTSGHGGTGIKYPWVISASVPNGNRLFIQNVRIEGAWNGIDAGNSMCAWIDGLQVCAFNVGISMGGTVAAPVRDWAHISDIEFWPFGMNSALQAIYNDGATIAMSLGSQNGLNAQNVSCFNSQIIFTSDASGGWFQFTNLSMDSPFATITVNNAFFLQITNVYFAMAAATPSPALNVLNGIVQVANMLAYTGSTQPLLHVAVGEVTVSGFHMLVSNPSGRAVTVDSGVLRMTNGRIYPSVASAWTVPLVRQIGGNLKLSNTTIAGQAGSSGTAISVAADAAGNSLATISLGTNWINDLAAVPSPPLGSYGTAFLVPQSMFGGIGFGSQFGASNTDLSKHIALYSNTFGISATSGRVNYVAPTGVSHVFSVAGTDLFSVAGTQVTCAAPVVCTQAMTAPTVVVGAAGPTLRAGTGAATGTQPAGSLWLRTDGTTANRLYVSAGAGVWETGASAFNGIGRNLIHNPLFNVAQRGAGPWAGIQYTLDRWLCAYTTDTGAVAQAALADTDRTAIGDEAAQFTASVSFTGNVAAGADTRFVHNIENIRRLGGKTVTLSFYALASSAGLKLGANIGQQFGTGGSPSAAVYGNGQAVTLAAGTAWARYSLTFTVPSASGKTLGTNGDHYTSLTFWFSSGATNNVQAGSIGVQSGTINIWGVQLEIGSVATPLEKPDPRYDLSNCQRFYQTGFAQLNAYNTAGNTTAISVPMVPQMRAAPSIVISNPVYSNTSGAIAQPGDKTAFVAYATVLATGQSSWSYNFAASADL